MLVYDREKAVGYAEKWAFLRNPQYYNFDAIGGDCTNFVSQCLLAGGAKMNYSRQKGWYYQSANDKSPSWTGVEFLYEFLKNNSSVGPYAREVSKQEIQVGDIIQLSFDGVHFSHTVLVVGRTEEIRIASHTYDSYDKNIEEYSYQKLRFLHIEGVQA